MSHSFNVKKTLFLTLCWAIWIGVQSSHTGHGQETVPTDANAWPTAETILDRHIEATGGADAQRALKTKVMTGTFANDLGGHKFKADITVTAVAPNQSHVAIHHPQFNMVRVTNGKKAWEWRGDDGDHRHTGTTAHQNPGQTTWLEKPETARAIEEAVFSAHLDWRKNVKLAKTVGIVEINEQPAYEVEITRPNGQHLSQFYDTTSGRHVKTTRGVESSLLGNFKMDTLIERYRRFDGVWLATKTSNTLHTDGMGVGTQIYEYSDVALNSDVPGTLFEVPAALAK